MNPAATPFDTPDTLPEIDLKHVAGELSSREIKLRTRIERDKKSLDALHALQKTLDEYLDNEEIQK